MPSKRSSGLPSRKQILDFIASSDQPAGKREIARAFGLHGNDKIALKALLKDMADEGLIDSAPGRAFHKMGGVPKVTVLRVSQVDDSGTAWAVPEQWHAETPSPKLRIVERGRRGALGIGDGETVVVYDGGGIRSAPRAWSRPYSACWRCAIRSRHRRSITRIPIPPAILISYPTRRGRCPSTSRCPILLASAAPMERWSCAACRAHIGALRLQCAKKVSGARMVGRGSAHSSVRRCFTQHWFAATTPPRIAPIAAPAIAPLALPPWW